MLVAVAERSQVAEARRLACQAATQQGFSESDTGRIAIAATELATNLVKHAGGGEILIGSFDDSDPNFFSTLDPGGIYFRARRM